MIQTALDLGFPLLQWSDPGCEKVNTCQVPREARGVLTPRGWEEEDGGPWHRRGSQCPLQPVDFELLLDV